MILQQNMARSSMSLTSPNAAPQTTIYSGDWKSDWANDLADLMQQAEDAEQSLSYLSPCGSEAARKKLGSYYTPADVSLFFWTEFFALNGVKNAQKISIFWEQHHFIEPSAGAGALVLALLKKGAELGLSLHHLATTDLTIIDINQTALDFIQNQLSWLENRWEITFQNVRYICCDFKECTIPISPRIPLFFGNPPFVSNSRGSDWKNLFADFLDSSIRQSGPDGRCHFILPVSVAFSRDYARMREKIRETGKSVAISSFDNIPDTLFPSGKPKHTNTNKTNSQRCSILTIFPEETPRILSTRMHRWMKGDRERLLTMRPQYHDVTAYSLDSQFPRPENTSIIDYIEDAQHNPRFHTLLSKDGPYSLFVASVARNFIGFREDDASSVHHLRFDTKKALHSALLIISSDIFLNYWRTIGDGFHVTRTNLIDFPLHHDLIEVVNRNTAKGRKMWKNRTDFAKTKRHPGGITTSYDFSAAALHLIDKF